MRGAIFDMDGVLIDSEPLWREAEKSVFASVGIALSDADCERTMGMRTDEVVAAWYCRRPWRGKSPGQLERDLTAAVLELIESRGEAMPGAVEALEVLARQGFMLGLASSSAPVLIEAAVRKLGIRRYFAALCSAIDEPYGKPHPDVYLTAARRLGVAPESCIAFEDSIAGVQSARTAGMWVVAVPPANLADDSTFARADLKLGSLEELTLGVLPAP